MYANYQNDKAKTEGGDAFKKKSLPTNQLTN